MLKDFPIEITPQPMHEIKIALKEDSEEKIRIGDLIKAKQCYYEQTHGVPEYGLVVDTENRKSIKQEVRGVLIVWMPHKCANPQLEWHQNFVPHWHLANRMEKVA